MINVTKFCPFERISAILQKIGYDNGQKSMTVKFNEFPVVLQYSNLEPDRDVGFSVDEKLRRQALASDEITGVVTFHASNEKTYNFRCRNQLLTDGQMPASRKIADKLQVNGKTSQKSSVFYPEAATTTVNPFIPINSDYLADVACIRPFISIWLRKLTMMVNLLRSWGHLTSLRTLG